MSRGEELRLQDILEAIDAIRGYLVEGKLDPRTNDAVLYNLVVIGEAAGQISDETRGAAPEIAWSKVVGLRNLIAHEYFRVDIEIIESIVAEQFDDLEQAARRLLEG